MDRTLEMLIRKAVDEAFERREEIIMPEEIAAGLIPEFVKAVQREIDSRFGPPDSNGIRYLLKRATA